MVRMLAKWGRCGVVAGLAVVLLASGTSSGNPHEAKPLPELRNAATGKLSLKYTTGYPADSNIGRGSFPSKVARPLILQRKKQGGRWRALTRRASGWKSNKLGRFKFYYEATCTLGTESLRVKAPRVTIRGKTYKPLVSPIARFSILPLPQVHGNLSRYTNSPRTGVSHPALSEDGRYVAYLTIDCDGAVSWRLADRGTGAVVEVAKSRDVGTFGGVVLSGNGRVVGFATDAKGLVSSDRDASEDVFIFDQATGSLTRLLPAGRSATFVWAMSADGQTVVVQADIPAAAGGAGPGMYRYNRATGAISLIANGATTIPTSISGDGRYIAYGDNLTTRVGIFDAETGEHRVVADAASMSQANGGARVGVRDPYISSDGRFVAYVRYMNGNPSVWVYDLALRTATEVAPGGALGALSADGRYLVYTTSLENDIYRKDLLSGSITRVSGGGDTHAGRTRISLDGRTIAFTSLSSRLVPGDRNRERDVFVWQE